MEVVAWHGWTEPAGDGAVHGSIETIGERIGAHLQMHHDLQVPTVQNAITILQTHVTCEGCSSSNEIIGDAKKVIGITITIGITV